MKASGKVLFFFPSYRSPEAAPPLALLALAGPLMEAGFQVEIVDSTVHSDYPQRILAHAGDSLCLGISLVTGPMIREAVEMGRLVKRKHPTLPIVLGGWHPSTLPEQTLKADFVDVVVRGQGELTFLELVKAYATGAGPAGIEGLSYRVGEQICHNPPRPRVDLNTLPEKPYHLVNFDLYQARSGMRWALYTSSHGCPYNCAYCSNASVYGRNWHGLNADRVVREVTSLASRHHLDLVDIIDDNFLVDRQRGLDIARGILDSGVRFGWYIQTTANFVNRLSITELELMARSGMRRIFIGADSGSEEVLRGIDKARFQSPDDIRQVAAHCHRCGIRTTFSIIFGLPGESEADRRETLRFIREIKTRHPASDFLTNIYTPYPGAPNFQQALALGVNEPKSLEEWVDFFPRHQVLPWLRGREHRRVQTMREYMRLAYDPRPIDQEERASLLHRALAAPARLRLNRDFYALPFELWLLSGARALKRRLLPRHETS